VNKQPESVDKLNDMYHYCQLRTRSLWDYPINKFDKEFIFWTFQKAFDKYHLSIEIDIEQLLAYARKNGIEDSFFRRLKLIVCLILMKPYIINSILGINNLWYWCIDLHQANTLLYV